MYHQRRGADYKTAEFAYYRYLPSEAAAIIFCIFFALLAIAHSYKLYRTRTWFFIPFFVGVIFEAIGYAFRADNASQSPNWSLTPFIVQYLLILLAPALFAASMYMMIGRIIRATDGDSHTTIRRTWLTKIFVFGDVLSFFTQAAGGSIQANAKTNPKNSTNGQRVILIGLIIQILFFAFFIITASIFHARMRCMPTEKSQRVPWRSHMVILYVTNGLILVRSIFRAVEYGTGNDGYLLRHEAFLYVFDAVLMTVVVSMYVWKYPNEISDYLRAERVLAVQSSQRDVEPAYEMVVGSPKYSADDRAS